METDTVN